MSGDESLAGPMEGLKCLNIDQTELYENYNFKDPSDKSNELQIYKSKEKVCICLNILKFYTKYFELNH